MTAFRAILVGEVGESYIAETFVELSVCLAKTEAMSLPGRVEHLKYPVAACSRDKDERELLLVVVLREKRSGHGLSPFTQGGCSLVSTPCPFYLRQKVTRGDLKLRRPSRLGTPGRGCRVLE